MRASGFGYFALLAMIPFLLGRRVAIGFALLTTLTGWIVWYVENQTDWLPVYRPFNASTTWMLYIGVIWLIVILLDLAAQDLIQSLSRARQAEAHSQFLNEFQHLISLLATEVINLGPGEIDSGIRHVMQAVSEFVDADLCRIWPCGCSPWPAPCFEPAAPCFAPAASCQAAKPPGLRAERCSASRFWQRCSSLVEASPGRSRRPPCQPSKKRPRRRHSSAP